MFRCKPLLPPEVRYLLRFIDMIKLVDNEFAAKSLLVGGFVPSATFFAMHQPSLHRHAIYSVA
jgi:hypothetical protein